MGSINGYGSWFDRARIRSAFCNCCWSVGQYFIRIGDALSQLANVIIFFGDNPNESVSGRAYRLNDKFFWKQLQYIIDFIFSIYQEDHCFSAYNADLARALKLINDQ